MISCLPDSFPAAENVMAVDYNANCPVGRALDIFGDRWSLLILRDLFQRGPRKFADFSETLSGISPNTLSSRLKTLEANGILERRFYEEHPPRAEYVLTQKGKELGPVLKGLLAWGEKYTGVKSKIGLGVSRG